MNNSAWEQFEPAALFANRTTVCVANLTLNIEFEAWFNEGEVAWSQSNRHVPLKDFADERLHRSDKIGYADFLLDHETFHLVEGVLV